MCCIVASAIMILVARGIELSKIELELEGDINITSVWGTGDTAPKPVGFTAIRARAYLDAKADRETLAALLSHAVAWSPVAGSVRNPVPLEVRLA